MRIERKVEHECSGLAAASERNRRTITASTLAEALCTASMPPGTLETPPSSRYESRESCLSVCCELRETTETSVDRLSGGCISFCLRGNKVLTSSQWSTSYKTRYAQR